MAEKCKLIENHIKSLLFKEDPALSNSSVSSELDSSKENLISPPKVPLGENTANSSNVPLWDWEWELPLENQEKLFSNHVNKEVDNCLIDRVALTKFAAQHLESSLNSDSDLALTNSTEKLKSRINGSPKLNQLTDCNRSLSNQDAISSETNLASESQVSTHNLLSELEPSEYADERHSDKALSYEQRKIKRERSKAFKKKKRELLRERKLKSKLPEWIPDGTPVQPIVKEVKQKTIKILKRESVESVKSPQVKGVTESKNVEDSFHCNFNINKAGIKEYSLRNLKQVQLNFFCGTCEYDSLEAERMASHLAAEGHVTAIQVKESDKFLQHLPEPLPAQSICINMLILEHVERFGLSEHLAKDRKRIANEIDSLVSKKVTDCSISLIGSSASGFGLLRSYLDLVLNVPSEVNAADMLALTYSALQQNSLCHNVYSEFREKIPRIEFQYDKLKAKCCITLDAGNARQMTQLLSMYSCLDKRVSVLGKALKLFANGCDIDQPDKGTLPSFCYILLLIYFLQQTTPPVLPVLELEEIQQYMNIDVSIFEKSYGWMSQNHEPVGSLWIKLLRFYCFEYQPGVDVVSICSSKKVTCTDKNWGTKFFAIEDPFVRRNLAHVIPTRKVFTYIHECFFSAYRYFGYPRLKSKEVRLTAKNSSIPDRPSDFPTTTEALTESDSVDDTHSDVSFHSANMIEDLLDGHDPDLSLDKVISTVAKLNLDSEEENGEKSSEKDELASCSTASTVSNSEIRNISSERNVVDKGTPHQHEEIVGNETTQFVYSWDIAEDEVTYEMMEYKFDSKIFRGEKSLPLVCRICQKSGHLKNNCPDEVLPPVLPLPKMTRAYMDLLSDMCTSIRDDNRPTLNELVCREKDTAEIERIIRGVFQNAKLQLFGSFCNGFGFANSDMDFCLTFKGNEDGKDLDHVKIIQAVSAQLQRYTRFTNVVPIVSAKVPIVKFSDKFTGLESDISVYNSLAQHNTRMLEMYCKIDPRVQIIGYTLKYFAKTLDICDASRGSLSSYAYTLMAIFFLQQRKPPVIPVLQELHVGMKPKVMVDGWNAWFFDKLDKIPKVWPDYRKNKESVGELWIGLLSFYASEFNMKEYVISIREKQPLARFRKLWNSKKIAIEDPFDLNHNLGSGLSRKMNNYIMKTFIQGRQHFGTPLPNEFIVQSGFESVVNYLFDRRALNRGYEPPNDRGCRRCGKIGHFVNSCPMNSVPKNVKQEERNKARRLKTQKQEKDRFENQPSTSKQVPKQNNPLKPGTPPRHQQQQQLQPNVNQSPESLQGQSVRFSPPRVDTRMTQPSQMRGNQMRQPWPQQSTVARPTTASPFAANQQSACRDSAQQNTRDHHMYQFNTQFRARFPPHIPYRVNNVGPQWQPVAQAQPPIFNNAGSLSGPRPRGPHSPFLLARPQTAPEKLQTNLNRLHNKF